jgi:hypothetical protein
MTDEVLIAIAGKDGEHINQKEILTKPITAEEAADPEALEARQKELLAESENIVRITTSVPQDKMETDIIYKCALENERSIEEDLAKARELAEKSKTTVKKTQEEARKLRRDAIRPRNINFDGTTHQKP